MADQTGSNTESGAARRQELSALIDGESSAAGVERLCVDWRVDAALPETWHAYSVIGDVLRSADLASSPAHDRQFLRDFRARMTAEPIVLAPEPLSSTAGASAPAMSNPSPRRSNGRAWAVPASVAAGVLVVVGAMMAVQTPQVADVDSARVAASPASPPQGATMKVSQVGTLAPPSDVYPAGMELVFDGQVIRDPRLDRYLLAHKQFSGTSVLGSTAGLLRNAATEVPAR